MLNCDAKLSSIFLKAGGSSFFTDVLTGVPVVYIFLTRSSVCLTDNPRFFISEKHNVHWYVKEIKKTVFLFTKREKFFFIPALKCGWSMI